MQSLIEDVDLVFTLGVVIKGVCDGCYQGARESPTKTPGLNHCGASEVQFESALVQVKKLRRVYSQETPYQIPVLLCFFFLTHNDINYLWVFKTLDDPIVPLSRQW